MRLPTLLLAASLAFTLPAVAQTKHDHAGHNHGQTDRIAQGYFEDAQVAARPLSDWAGEWQSVYPFLQDGTLDGVMAHKAEHGTKSAKEYRDYYETGYRSDLSRITIAANGDFTFTKTDGTATSARYEADGHEILTYAKGNRGVRFIFKKVSGDAGAPSFVQFSDHRIAPSVSDHYHIYLGEDRAALLDEVTHWPTFYPATLTGAQVAAEMMAH